MAILWRNQSADRVMYTRAGEVIYRTTDFTIGELKSGSNTTVTLLRFTPDGGWVIAGSGHWLQTDSPMSAKLTLIANNSTGPLGALWLCAVQSDHTQSAQTISAIQLYDRNQRVNEQTYEFHNGGIVEPIVFTPTTELRLIAGSRVVYTFNNTQLTRSISP